MQVKQIAIDKIVTAAHNPKSRVVEGPRLRQLQRSIEKLGLIYPLAVTKDLSVIDGHRRLACCKALGWTEIPVLITAAEDPDAVYADVNATSARMSGAQNLAVWLKNPRAVTQRAASEFTVWEQLVGRRLLQRMTKEGLSLHTLRVARTARTYIGADESNNELLVQIANWLVTQRNSRMIEAYMSAGEPPALLYKVIKSGKALRPTFAAQESPGTKNARVKRAARPTRKRPVVTRR